MSVETVAKLKGFVEPKRICDYIKHNIDPNMTSDIKWETICLLSELKYKIDDPMPSIFAKSPEDIVKWRILSGFIYYNIFGPKIPIFYYYSPLQSTDEYEDCNDKELLEMINSETTSLRMVCCKESVSILTNLVKYFGGGWLDEDDSDNEDFYKIN